MSGRTTRSRANAAEAEGASSAVSAAGEAEVQPPPAKRAKMQKVKKPATVQNSRKKGKLSVLPTLPLDVLFEIFGHLGPADLLHLARTTKSFRNVLMSRQSAFLWKEVYDFVDEVDNFPCPEEVSLPKWINLVYGGPFCDEVGCSGRSNKVIWGLRRRLCKSCQDKLLVTIDTGWDVVGAEVMALIDSMSEVFPHDFVSRNGRAPHIMYLREDLHAISNEVRALAKDFDYPMQWQTYPPPKGSPEWEEAFAAFKTRRKNLCVARNAHAGQCSAKDDARLTLRSDELDGLKDARFADVKQRLVDMGFDAADAGAESIRAHKEVKQPKPLTDRVWTRISPMLRAEAERLRDERLEREQRARMASRYTCARRRHEEKVLSTVASSTVCYAPGFDVIFKHPRIATYLREDVYFDNASTTEYEACAAAFNEADVPALINDWITCRQAALRAQLPESWPRTSCTGAEIEAQWPSPTELPTISHYAELAGLDLVVYTYECAPTCRHGHRVFYGLDILAHDCLNWIQLTKSGYPTDPDEINRAVDSAIHASPLHDHHAAAIHVVQLLELDPTKARPVDLDRASRLFTGEPREPHAAGQPFFTWRQAVDAGATWCKLDSIRLATDREQTFVEKHHEVFHTTASLHAVDHDPDWACARCSSLRNPGDAIAPRYSSLADIRVHLELVHSISDAEEGQNYFYDRRRDRMQLDNGESGDDRVFKHLPHNVTLEGAIAALDEMGGNFSPFNLLNSLWPGGNGPPMWMTGLLGDFGDSLSDSDSDDSMDL